MKNINEKIDIINQSVMDTNYIKNTCREVRVIPRVLSFWLTLFSVGMAFVFGIDQIILRTGLYEQTNLFMIMNLIKIVIFLLVPFATYLYISKIRISLEERHFLKYWVVSPILISVIKVLAIVSTYINIDSMITYYDSYPLNLIFNFIGLLFLYLFYRYKVLLLPIILNLFAFVAIFIYVNIFYQLLNVSDLDIMLFNICEFLRHYSIVEIITILIVIIVLEGMKKHEKNNRYAKDI